MRLLLATPLYPPEIGGPATYASLLAESLPERGIEVEVIKFSDVRHLPKLIRHVVYYRRVMAAARKADLVLALDPVSVGLPALLAATSAEKPFVVKVVGDYAWEQGRQRFHIDSTLNDFLCTPQRNIFVRALQKIQTYVAQSAVQVIVPSAYLKDVVTQWGIDPTKITVIHNAVREEAKMAVPADVAKLSTRRIVSVGRLVPWKGFRGLIDAVAKIREILPDVSLVIVGDGPEYCALATHAHETLHSNYLLAGSRSRPETWNIIASASAFVLNSDYEGYSHVLVEARLIGVPIIATAIGGTTPDLVTDGQTGLLVPPQDTPNLVRALSLLLTNTELSERLRSNAKLSAHEFSLERMLASTTALFEQYGHRMSQPS